MKKVFLLYLSAAILLSSCYRPQDEDPMPIPAYNYFTVNGYDMFMSTLTPTITVTDSIIASVDLDFLQISASRLHDTVSWTITGFPVGIVVNSPTSGTITLRKLWSVYFNTENTDTGMYTLNLNISGAYGTHSYPIRLHVLPVPVYNAGLDHIYYASDPCGNYPSGGLGSIWYTYTCVVTALPGYPHTVKMQNYRGIGDSFFLYANVTGTGSYANLKVPLQTSGGYTIYGTGGTSPDTGPGGNEEPFIFIDDTLVHAGDTQICHSQLLQHPW